MSAQAAAPLPSLPAGIDLALIAAVDGPVGLAVSGGGDSVALAVLLAEAFAGRAFTILTVDHGLRPEAGEDVAAVRALGRRLGLAVVPLAARSAPAGSLQAWAREERYALLAEAAAAHGLAAVATGHTLDDQAETVLLRLARGSGLSGLAAMRARTERAGLVLLRPFLGVPRAALREALTARGIAWREDPSNADPRFDRTAMRALLPRLSAVGITPQRLAGTAAHLARASAAIDCAVAELLHVAARTDRAGAVRLHLPPWRAAPREVRLRACARLVQMAGGGAHPPRFEPLAALEAALAQGDVRTTLGRAMVDARGERAVLWREMRGIRPLPLRPGEAGVFDGRFAVRVSSRAPALTVDAIGQVRVGACPATAHRPAVASAPGIFLDERLVAAPTLGVRARDFPSGLVAVEAVR